MMISTAWHYDHHHQLKTKLSANTLKYTSRTQSLSILFLLAHQPDSVSFERLLHNLHNTINLLHLYQHVNKEAEH